MNRIILSTGGTGGHIFPALAVAEEIMRRNPESMILFVGGIYGQEADVIARAGFKFVGLPVRGVAGRGIKGLTAVFGMGLGLVKAIGILRKFRPQVVMGFGGYASFASVLAAKLCQIPTAIHEQNAFPGQSNRVLGKVVDKIFLSFPDKGYFPQSKCVLVGNPVRESIRALFFAQKEAKELEVKASEKQALENLEQQKKLADERRQTESADRRNTGTRERRIYYFPFPHSGEKRTIERTSRRTSCVLDRRSFHEIQSRLEARLLFLRQPFKIFGIAVKNNHHLPNILPVPKPVCSGMRGMRLLVMGGSLGAKALNQAVVSILPQLSRAGIEIWHQTGNVQYEQLREEYRAAGFGKVRVEAFIEDMRSAYAWADFAICRAGGSSLAELSLAGVPAILVPFPFATHNHQFYNAKYLADAGGAIILEQKDIVAPTGSVDVLAEKILALAKDGEKLKEMRTSSLAVAKPEAAEKMVDVLDKISTAK